MFGIVKELKESGLFKDIEIIDYIDEYSVKLLKLKAIIKNDDIIIITEQIKHDIVKYSYQWMDQNKNLICRWDNSPHYKNINTFPYHLHKNNEVYPSYKISIEELIKEIKGKIN